MQRQLGVLLVSDVADSAREVEVTVNPTFKVDRAASTIDPVSFLLIRWLVVQRERDSATTLRNDTAAIASVGANERLAHDKEDVGCAALTLHHLNGKLVLLDLRKGRLVGVVAKSPLHRRRLIGVLLRYSHHGFKALGSH